MNEDRIAGGLYGLLIGDALGVPYEFHPPELIPPLEAIELEPPPGFERSHAQVPPGTWSDDGAQALCLLDSLLAKGRFDLGDFASRLLEWYQHGLWAVDGVVFDVGIQTQMAFRALSAGLPPLDSGFARPDGKGNGSLMRVLPLALWHRGADAALVEDAHLQSRITHGHPTNQVCCALYCLWARRMLDGAGAEDGFADATEALRAIYPQGSTHRFELDDTIRPDDDLRGKGGGFVVDCLRSARDVLAAGADYTAVVKAAVALGNDTDTTAAVAGGLAGVRGGLEEIPARWLDALRDRDKVEPLLEQLRALR